MTAPITPITPVYTDVNGAADYYKVTAWTIRRWVKVGDLPATRLPGGHLRIRLADLDALGTPVQVGDDLRLVDQIRDYLYSDDRSVLAVVGMPRTGKAHAIAAATRGMTVVHFTPAELSSSFGLARAIAADVMVIEGGVFDSDATSALASLTGADPVQVRRKGQAAAAEVPTVKVLIASNIEPEFSGPGADTVRGRIRVMNLADDRSVA